MARIGIFSAAGPGKSSQVGGLAAAQVLGGSGGTRWHHSPGWGVTREHVSMATLADAGFKTITCGTSGSGCFFIANILLIVLCCAVILIKQDLESRRLKRVNQGHGTASTICIAITHSSPACGKNEGAYHKDPSAGPPLHPKLLWLRGLWVLNLGVGALTPP